MKPSRVSEMTLNPGECALASGSGALTVECGSLEVFGAVLTAGSRLGIHPGKRFPMYAPDSRTRVEIAGKLAIMTVVGDPLPKSWRSLPDLFLTKTTPRVVMVGPTDSGKTALTTYLVNVSLRASRRVGIVDGDPGQCDIGPPTCISGAVAKSSLVDLRDLVPTIMEFVGVTSPSLRPELCVKAVSSVTRALLSAGLDFLFLNTDGWVREGGLEQKRRVLEAVKPDVVVTLGLNEDLNWPVPNDARLVAAEVPKMVLVRNQQARYRTRLMNLLHYLRRHKLLVLDPSVIRNPGGCWPGSILALLKNGRVKSLGVVDSVRATSGLQAYCGTEDFDEVVRGSASMPEALEHLRERSRHQITR